MNKIFQSTINFFVKWNLKKITLFALAGVGVLCIIFGSFFDWEISKNVTFLILPKLYLAVDPISIIVEVLGGFIPFIILASCFIILYQSIQPSQNSEDATKAQFIKGCWMWLSVICYAIGLRYMVIKNIITYIYIANPILESPIWLELIIYILTFGLSMLLSLWNIKIMSKYKIDYVKMKSWIILTIIFIVIFMLFPIIFKSMLYRPRYRAIAYFESLDPNINKPVFNFVNWYQMRIININNNEFNNEYVQSFPSGHVLIILSLLVCLTLPIKKRYYFVIYGIILIVCIGRVISGAHYLSDVGWSIVMGLIIFSIYNTILNHKKNIYLKKNREKIYN